MKKIKLTMLLALSIVNENVQAIDPLTLLTPVNDIVNNITNSASELISQAEAAGTATGFAFTSDVNIVLQNVKTLGEHLSGKVFSDLNQSQQATFRNALAFLTESQRSLDAGLSQAQTVISSLGGEISRIPTMEKYPLLNSYKPSYILASRESGERFDISFRGSRLNSSPTLFFGDVTCNLVESTETGLRFSCPKNTFSSDKNTWRTGKLNFVTNEGTFLTTRKSYNYKIGVMGIPEKLGSYTLAVYENRPTQRIVPRRASNRWRNRCCQNPHHVAWTYRPATGCTIDVTSINPGMGHSAASIINITDITSNGFVIRGVAINHGGPCIFCARGSVWAAPIWNDVCAGPLTEVQLQPGARDRWTGDIKWMEQLSFPLPQTASRFILTVQQLNGESKSINGTINEKWFIVSYDSSTKVISLRPNELAQALK